MDAVEVLTECRNRIELVIDLWEREHPDTDENLASAVIAKMMGITDHAGFIEFVGADCLETLRSRPPSFLIAPYSLRSQILTEVIDAMAVSFISGLNHGYQLALMRIDDPDLGE